MNICFISEEWPGENDYGGIGFHFQNVATYLVNSHHKVVIIYNGSKSRLIHPSYRLIGVKSYVRHLSFIHRFVYNSLTYFIVKRLKRIYPEFADVLVWNILAVITFVSLVKKNAFDIVETHDYHSTPFLLITGFFSHLVVTIQGWKKMTLDLNHDSINFEKRLLIANEYMFMKYIKQCYANSFLSRAAANKYFHKNISTVIYNAVDTDFFSPKSTYKDYILFVGRYERRKGILQLIQAYQNFCRTVGIENAPMLYLVGGKSHMFYIKKQLYSFSNLLHIIVTKRIRKKIKLISYKYHYELKRYYQQCRFCVLPSIFEPFGNTVGEALSCGKIVITTKKTGAAEILCNNRNIIIVKLNKQAIRKSMLYVFQNNDIRHALEIEARHAAIQNFSIPTIGKQVLAYYKHILSNNVLI